MSRSNTAGDPLTPRQAEILAWIESYHLTHSYPPSMREIGRRFGISSTNGVNDHLRYLEAKGAILPRVDLRSRCVVSRRIAAYLRRMPADWTPRSAR